MESIASRTRTLENSLFDTYKYTYIIYEKEHVIEEATQVQSGD